MRICKDLLGYENDISQSFSFKKSFFSGISLPGTFGVRFPQQIWDDFLAMYRMSFFWHI